MGLRKVVGVAIVFSLLSAPSVAGETRKGKLWRISLAVLGSAAVADTCFSWDKMEANPLLKGSGGRFGARGVTLKASVTGAAMIIQWRLVRKDPKVTPYFATANLATAGILTGAAVRNFRAPSVR
jgi:hypothetical protein